MRLLLDEMYSPEIARQLQAKGHDVESIQADRPELQSVDDEVIVERMHAEQRAIVTNNVKDFMPIHNDWIGAGRSHSGLVFSSDRSMPRSRKTIGLWVATLEQLLADHPERDELSNRFRYLTPSP